MLHAYSSKKKSIKTATCLIVFACLIIYGVHAQKLAEITKPNIIFILADDVGFRTPTVNGGQSYSTPNIDSMARHGINFTHCESSPLCCTSRSMLLTGKYLNRNYSNWGYITDTGKTIGNVMKDAGYVTGFFGKFQFQYSVGRMHNWGWDKHILFELTEDTMAHRRYKNPVLRENGYRIPDSQTFNKYCDDILTDRILRFIDSNKTRSFFAFYSMSLGHDPFSPTPDDPAFANWNPKQKGDTTYYPSMMKYMDKKIGIILNKLKQTGLANNTIVMFAGDNGTPITIYYNANGKMHIKGEKGETTEGGTHVPLVVYWPGHIQEGSVNDDLIDFTDFLPTFAQAGKLKNLGAYGQLDGISFYPKILGNPGKIKKQLYCFYARDNYKDSTKIWVRDKTYKLYDSTGFTKSGKFYNIVNDPKELSPLSDNKLTAYEKALKANFKLILDTSYYWPDCPVIINPFSTNVTSSSATVGATITGQGASMLKEKGSSLTANEQIFLSSDRLPAGTVGFGKFSQQRTGLQPQTEYKYLVYAMNNNASHSTAAVTGIFTTLAKAPLQQPAFFTSSINSGIVYLNWGNTKFPSSGAKDAGYLLVYSKDSIKILQNPNGKPPGSIVLNGQVIPTVSTVLPNMPAIAATKPGLSPGTYKFLLIPYTWNGSNTATYNYLTKNALTTTAVIQPSAFNKAATTSKTELPVSLEKPALYPIPSTGNINISYDHGSPGKTQIKVFDLSGKIVFTKTETAIKGNNIYNLDLSNLKPGMYYLELTDGNEQNRMKFIIQK